MHRPVSFEQNYTGMNLFEEGADYEAKSKMFSSSPVNDIFGVRLIDAFLWNDGNCSVVASGNNQGLG